MRSLCFFAAYGFLLLPFLLVLQLHPAVCIFRFIWAFVPYRLIIVPGQTDQTIWNAFISRATLCSAWLSIEHDQKQCQWGIYAVFSPCHWLLLLVVLPISCSGILLSSKRNQWSVYIGHHAQMSRNLHAVPVSYLELLLFYFGQQKTVAEIPLMFLPDLLLTLAVHRQDYEDLWW